MKSEHFQEPLAKGTSTLVSGYMWTKWQVLGLRRISTVGWVQRRLQRETDAVRLLEELPRSKSKPGFKFQRLNQQNWNGRILLQGEDRLLLLSYRGNQLEDITWEHLQVPHTYLNDNWPVRVSNSTEMSVSSRLP